jgi:hypothetical protein
VVGPGEMRRRAAAAAQGTRDEGAGVDREHRGDRARRALGPYLERAAAGGAGPPRSEEGLRLEEAIPELLCDLRHLADRAGLDRAGLEERAGRRHAGHRARHVVEVTAEGYQVLDTATDALRADVWGGRGAAQDACEELDEAARGG